MMSFARGLLLLFLALCLALCSIGAVGANGGSAAGSGGGVYGGRHSYSLSTFSPSGDLDQVVRAMRASMLGTPMVAVCMPPSDDLPDSGSLPPGGGIYLSMPLRFLASSPFLVDDGTPRVVQPTSSICVAHTGVGADGRALCDVAVQLALDYRYVYGEEISAEELLEGLAERVQEMTMKAGARPYGCALLVGCLGGSDGDDAGPAMYRVDPSGAVILLNSRDDDDALGSSQEVEQDATVGGRGGGGRGSLAFLGNWEPLRQKRDAIRTQLEVQQFTSEEEVQRVVVDAAKQTYMDETPLSEEVDSQSFAKRRQRPILLASFTRERGLQITRVATQEQND